jgi:signal transduction histidine kinase/CheY-like chemotaxis protein
MTDVVPHSVTKPSGRSLNPLTWFLRWLRNVPVTDPVEKRNAPMLQVVLLIFGILFPLSNLPRWISEPIFPINVPVELKTLVTTALIWTAFGLVRRGRFRLSASIFIAMAVAMMGLSYYLYGLQAELAVQVTQMVPLVLCGLLLGRRALWLMVLSLVAIQLIGMTVDLQGHSTLPDPQDAAEGAIFNFFRCSLGFAVVALVIDRAVSALRETLELSNRRGEDLLRIEQSLREEIAEKERSQAQLIQAQKVEAVGRLSSGIAHDFNNILGVIMGYASRPDATESLPVAADSLDGIKLAAQRGAMTIRRILSLGRNDNGKLEVVEVHAVVADMLPLMKQLFGERIALHTVLTDAPMPVAINRGEFELALLNLATNARDAMPDGGTFTVTAGIEGEEALLTLADDGAGMDAGTLARVFDLFYTTKPEGLGSGIGLAVVKRFVEDAGGRLEIHSEPGEGTSLALRLPLATAFDENPAVADIGGMHILLVEDDEALRGLLADALRAAGATVLAAGSARAAAVLARKAPQLDVLVSDFHLPDATGNDVLQQVAAMHPMVRCLVISANETLAAVRPRLGRTVQVLAKPFEPSRLVEAVGVMVSRESV